jgi:hypothetical protein
MKRFGLTILLVGLIASSAYASATAQQTGNWNDPCTWKEGVVPATTAGEIKFTGGDDFTVTVNDARGTYGSKLALCRGNELLITGGSIGFADDVKVGDAGASSSGTDIGTLTVTGGTLTAGDRIVVGYKAGGEGYMTISGGVVDVTGGGGFKVGCEDSDGMYGYLKIEGDGGTLNVADRFHIANDSTSSSGDIGHGVVEFELNAGGNVSRIVCEYVTIDSQDEVDALAELIVTATGTVNTADIVLFESTSTSSTVGEFDTVNGVAAAQDALVQVGTEWFRIDYAYDCDDADLDDNDIALVWVPEPATMALMALGLFAIRRKK